MITLVRRTRGHQLNSLFSLFFWGHDPITHVRRARYLTAVGESSVSVSVCLSVCLFVDRCTDLTPLHSCTVAPSFQTCHAHSTTFPTHSRWLKRATKQICICHGSGASVIDATSGNARGTPGQAQHCGSSSSSCSFRGNSRQTWSLQQPLQYFSSS